MRALSNLRGIFFKAKNSGVISSKLDFSLKEGQLHIQNHQFGRGNQLAQDTGNFWDKLKKKVMVGQLVPRRKTH